MSMVTHGFVPLTTSAIATGTTGTAVAVTDGAASLSLLVLGVVLLVLTIIFALAAVRDLLPRRGEVP